MGNEAEFALLERQEPQADAVVRRILTGPAPLGKTAHPGLWLGSLPGRISRLAGGMLYGLACDQQAVRVPLLAAALLEALQAGKPCALLTPSDPGMLLRKARLAGLGLDAFVKGGALEIFQVANEAAKHIFRAGAEGFLAQLEKSFPHREGFAIFDQADALFMLSDPQAAAEAAQHYQEWVAARGHTLLALFAPAAHAPRDYLTLRRVAENFGGFAVARPADGGAVLEIRHWFAAGGASSRESFVLSACGGAAPGVQSAALADYGDDLPPVESVIHVRGALDELAPAWRSWHQAGSISEALDAASCSDAATLVLAFQQPGEHESLCRAVAAVRAMARPFLRIVVRERRVRLRASQALALTRLGASAILPADLPERAAKRMVDSLQGTRFTRPYDTDLQQVLEETTGLVRRNVTGAAAFCDAVERLLAAADGFDVESCLVRLQTSRAEASKAVALARRLGREIVASSQGGRAWLFMFGCPERAAPEALERILSSIPDLRSKLSLEHDPDRILTELRGLREPSSRQ